MASLFKPLLLLLAAQTAVSQVPIGIFTTRAHLVAGVVSALSERVLLIENFVHDGLAPAVYFWGDTSERPSSGGFALLDAAPTGSCGTISLPEATGSQDYIVEFPEGRSLKDILGGSISVWCEAFNANFGEVIVPATLEGLLSADEGPALACASPVEPPEPPPAFVATPEGYNCEPLNNDYQVRWQVDGDNLNVELIGRIEEGVYMGFGVSGSDSETNMVGADPVVADFFNGMYRARDFYMSARAQCAAGNGVCPESDNGFDGDTSNVSGDQGAGLTVVRYTRPLTPTNVDATAGASMLPVDRSISVVPGVSTFVVWALGPIDDFSGLPFFHFIDYPRVDVSIEFGRAVQDGCQPLVDIPEGEGEEATPFFRPILTDVTEFTAHIGPSGGRRGYAGITGEDAWGISWYINDLLIPVIEMRRGTTYRFLVNGGDNDAQNSQFHPLYLTSNNRGGFAEFFPNTAETVFAGINLNGATFEPTAVGPLCAYTATDATTLATDNLESFSDYFATLDTSCSEDNTIVGAAGVLEFTPDESTPNYLYYQCVTHRALGWEIHVIDADAPSLLEVDCSAFSETTMELDPNLTLNAIINPNDNTLQVELVYEGTGWVAMAFTANQTTMVGAEAVIGLPGEENSQSNPGKYNLNARQVSGIVLMQDDQQTLMDSSIEQNETHTVLKFTKLLVEAGEHPISAELSNTFLWAVGATNTFVQHSKMGSFSLLPPQCAVSFNGEAQNENFVQPEKEEVPAGPIFCFSGSSLVNVKGDKGVTAVPMRLLKIGDMVETDVNKYEPTYAFGHHSPGARAAKFLQITTTNGSSLQLSADHMVFHKGDGFVPASDLSVGDILRDGQGEDVAVKAIQTIELSTGIYAPFTPSGQIVVNNVLASSFVAFENNAALEIVGGLSIPYQWLAHTFEFPHRVACYYFGSCPRETYTQDGISTWVAGPHRATRWMLEMPHGILKTILLITSVTVFAIFSFLESVLTNPISCLVTAALVGFTTTRAVRKTKQIIH